MRWGTRIAGLALVAAACGEGLGQDSGQDVGRAMEDALASGTGVQGVVARRLYSGDDVYDPFLSTFSPDGRFEALRGTMGDLEIRDLETGEIRNLTRRDIEAPGWNVVEAMAFSSDGGRVAFDWYGVHPSLNPEGRQALHVMNVDGSDARTVLDPRARDRNEATPYDWSPDDQRILVEFGRGVNVQEGRPDFRRELATVAVADGSVEVLEASAPLIALGRAFFSPDGRWVAYSAVTDQGDGLNDVVVLDPESGSRTVVLGGPSNDELLGWSESGDHLFALSDRGGSPSIWALPVRGSRNDGPPVLIRRDLYGFVSGHVAGGKLFYHVASETPRLYTVDLDPTTGEPLSEPSPVDPDRRVAEGRLPAWSPDGESLAYVRGTPAQIVVRAARDGNHVQAFPLPDGFTEVHTLRWSPDGRTLLLAATSLAAPGTGRMMRLDLDRGEFETGGLNPAERNEVTHDGGRLFGVARRGGVGVEHLDPPLTIPMADITSGRSVRLEMLYDQPEPVRGDRAPRFTPSASPCHVGGGRPTLSPSDDRLAFTTETNGAGGWPSCLGVISTEGGAVDWIYRGTTGELEGAPVWTADGRTILFQKRTEGEVDEIWMVPATGGEPRRLFAFGEIRDFDLHPDGDRLVFQAGPEHYELWVMEGLEEAVRAR